MVRDSDLLLEHRLPQLRGGREPARRDGVRKYAEGKDDWTRAGLPLETGG